LEGRKVKSVADMSDEHLMKHFERSHADALKLKFTVEPDQDKRRLHARDAWEAYHQTIHRMYPVSPTDEHFH